MCPLPEITPHLMFLTRVRLRKQLLFRSARTAKMRWPAVLDSLGQQEKNPMAEPRSATLLAGAVDPVTLQIVRGGAARHPERDGGADRAHGHVAVHPREEGLLCRRCLDARRTADRRLESCPSFGDVVGADRRALSARDHAAGRHLLVQRLLRLQGRRLALARPGVRRAGVRRRRARRLRAVLGALQRHRRHARRARCRPTAPRSSRKASSCRRCGSRARA